MRCSRTLSLVSILPLIALGCRDALQPLGPDQVAVRVRNASAVPFDETTLYLMDGPRALGRISAGGTSAYVVTDTAYRFMTTQAIVGSDTLRLQVIDYVGEQPLSPGHYTYVLSIYEDEQGARRLDQTLEED
jgi:hypothetical protein